MDLVRTAPPAALFADLALIKAQLRIDNVASDVILAQYAAVAEQHLDGRFGYLQRALLTQDWKLTLWEWPASGCQLIPLPPLASIVSVQYYDQNNALQTLAADQYVVVTGELMGRLEAAPLALWPSTYWRRDAVQISFRAGYGAALAAVPAPIVQGALLIVANMFANRGDNFGAAFTPAVKNLLGPHRIVEFS